MHCICVCVCLHTSVEVVAGEQTGWRVDAGHGLSAGCLTYRVSILERERGGEREREVVTEVKPQSFPMRWAPAAFHVTSEQQLKRMGMCTHSM